MGTYYIQRILLREKYQGNFQIGLIRKEYIISIVIFVLYGCATGKIDYDPPIFNSPPEPSIIINKNINEVWKELIPALGKRFFVINNLDKETGFINISYNGDPRTFIDCGEITSTVVASGVKKTYKFKAAKAYHEYKAVNPLFNVVTVRRKMKLEGRINIIVEALNLSKTRATAITRYVVTKSWTARDVSGKFFESGSKTIYFNTGQKAKFANIATTCCANGNLEKEILSLLSDSKQL